MNNFFDMAPKVWNEILDRLFPYLEMDDKIELSVHSPGPAEFIHTP